MSRPAAAAAAAAAAAKPNLRLLACCIECDEYDQCDPLDPNGDQICRSCKSNCKGCHDAMCGPHMLNAERLCGNCVERAKRKQPEPSSASSEEDEEDDAQPAAKKSKQAPPKTPLVAIVCFTSSDTSMTVYVMEEAKLPGASLAGLRARLRAFARENQIDPIRWYQNGQECSLAHEHCDCGESFLEGFLGFHARYTLHSHKDGDCCFAANDQEELIATLTAFSLC